MAFYDAIPASDGTSLNAPSNAEFKVFEVTDTARANPLELRTVAGMNAAPLITTAQGVVPPVEVVSPNFEHIFKSGEWEWRRESSEGIKRAALGAQAAAEEAVTLVKMPTDQAVDAGIDRADIPRTVANEVASQPTVVAAASTAASTAIAASDLLRADDPRALRAVESTAYALPFVDREGYVAGGVQTDGAFNMEVPPRVMGEGGVTLHPLNGSEREWAIPFVDQEGRVAGGIRPDGTAEFFKLKGGLGGGFISSIANEMAGFSRSSRVRVSAIGDSLTNGFFDGAGNQTADAYPAKLQALLPAGVEVFNLSASGWSTDEIAVRIGALPLPMTVTGGSIPASGDVNVTTTTVAGWSGGVRWMDGTLAGVPGRLLHNEDAGTNIFRRAAAGAATPVTPGTVFVPDYAGHEGDTLVIMLGRNDVFQNIRGTEASVAEHVVAGIGRIVDWMSPTVKHVLLLGVTTTTAETSGTEGYGTVTAINKALAAKYPSRFFDLRRYLVDKAIYDLGIIPTDVDLQKMAADTLPPSIMNSGDATHYSRATAALVAAQVYNYLITRGWV